MRPCCSGLFKPIAQRFDIGIIRQKSPHPGYQVEAMGRGTSPHHRAGVVSNWPNRSWYLFSRRLRPPRHGPPHCSSDSILRCHSTRRCHNAKRRTHRLSFRHLHILGIRSGRCSFPSSTLIGHRKSSCREGHGHPTAVGSRLAPGKSAHGH